MLDEIRGCNHRLDGRLQIGAAAASDMAHRQLIRDHQDITSLFGRVYSPIVISSPQLFRREARFIDLIDKPHLVTQPDRGNEWPGTLRPACGIEYPLLATAKSAGETVFRSEEHTSELQSLMRNSYAGFCLKHKKTKINQP